MRDKAIDLFLLDNGWGNNTRMPLASDASFRRYERIWHDNGNTAMLMDAPPGKEDVRPFITIARHLSSLGHSAPAILAQDAAQGLLLLEDLGDDSFSAILKRPVAEDGPNEPELYATAVEWLARLHAQPASIAIDLPPYDQDVYLREVSLFADWFLPAALGDDAAESLRAGYLGMWRDMLASLPASAPQLVHRDYHADNLLWLPNRHGVARLGILDFQDALLGPAAYDLVSILEDARRDVSPEIVDASLTQYLKESGADETEFRAAYALLGAQRNSKIIGIFTRLAVRDAKPHYLSFLPRVWAHLETDISHPVTAPLKEWLDRYLPLEKRHIVSGAAL